MVDLLKGSMVVGLLLCLSVDWDGKVLARLLFSEPLTKLLKRPDLEQFPLNLPPSRGKLSGKTGSDVFSNKGRFIKGPDTVGKP